MLPEDYCRDAAAPPGSNLHYSTLFQTPAERRALFALFALLGEIAQALRVSPEPAVGLMRLHWWMEQIGRSDGGAGLHPVTAEIAREAQRAPWLRDELAACIAAAAHPAAAPARYEDWVEPASSVHGRIWGASARLCAAELPLAETAGRIGALIGAVEDLRDLAFAARAGRLTLPLDAAARHGVAPDALGDPARHGAVSGLIAEMCRRLQADLLRHEETMRAARCRPLLYSRIAARLAAALCPELADEGAGILRHRVALTPLRKLWIASRTRISA